MKTSPNLPDPTHLPNVKSLIFKPSTVEMEELPNLELFLSIEVFMTSSVISIEAFRLGIESSP